MDKEDEEKVKSDYVADANDENSQALDEGT